MEDRRRENRVRARAARRGYMVRKSRAAPDYIDNRGGYQIVDANTNAIVGGEKFDLTIDDVEKWLEE